jgi:FkbM family methyltransferase
MNLASYKDELRYIRRAVPSWVDKLKLLAATLEFHANNAIGRSNYFCRNLKLQVLIDGLRCQLNLRPNRGDLFILYEILASEAYAVHHDFLKPEEAFTILDCGANVGITALYFARKYKNARIICIEPDPENFETLKLNVANQKRIEPIFGAIVKTSGTVHLTRNRPAYGNTLIDQSSDEPTVAVQGLTIADICEQKELTRIDLLKVDIEGAEEELFKDADFLPMVNLVAIELHMAYRMQDFHGDVKSYGFDVYSPSNSKCRHAHLACRV